MCACVTCVTRVHVCHALHPRCCCAQAIEAFCVWVYQGPPSARAASMGRARGMQRWRAESENPRARGMLRWREGNENPKGRGMQGWRAESENPRGRGMQGWRAGNEIPEPEGCRDGELRARGMQGWRAETPQSTEDRDKG